MILELAPIEYAIRHHGKHAERLKIREQMEKTKPWGKNVNKFTWETQNIMMLKGYVSKAIHETGRGGPTGLWDVEVPTFSRQSAQRWWSGCQPYAPASPLPSGRFQVLVSVRGWVEPRAIMWLEVLSQLKNPMTSPGIELATFRLVS
jgi:hypothetical protein